MVHDDGGDTAGGQTDDAGGFKIGLHNDDTVQTALPRMLIIIALGGTAPADEGEVIAVAFRFQTKLVEKRTEIFVIHPVFVNDTDIVGLASFQRPGGGIRIIPHILGCLADKRSALPAVTC